MKKQLLTIIVLFYMVTSVYSQQSEYGWLNIVYIGNSITQGVLIDSPRKNAPPVQASIYLQKQPGIGEVKYSNQGVSGSTTVDFLPETNTLFNHVKEAAGTLQKDEWATLVFSIMLGTNDSAVKGPNGSPVSPEQYRENMQKIIDELFRLYPDCKVILHRPVWYSPNTYNTSMYMQEGLDRLQRYFPEIDALITHYNGSKPGQVFSGDTDAFDYFRENWDTLLIPEQGNAGIFYLHPNEKGAAVLGEFWGKAIYKVLYSK